MHRISIRTAVLPVSSLGNTCFRIWRKSLFQLYHCTSMTARFTVSESLLDICGLFFMSFLWFKSKGGKSKFDTSLEVAEQRSKIIIACNRQLWQVPTSGSVAVFCCPLHIFQLLNRQLKMHSCKDDGGVLCIFMWNLVFSGLGVNLADNKNHIY